MKKEAGGSEQFWSPFSRLLFSPWLLIALTLAVIETRGALKPHLSTAAHCSQLSFLISI